MKMTFIAVECMRLWGTASGYISERRAKWEQVLNLLCTAEHKIEWVCVLHKGALVLSREWEKFYLFFCFFAKTINQKFHQNFFFYKGRSKPLQTSMTLNKKLKGQWTWQSEMSVFYFSRLIFTCKIFIVFFRHEDRNTPHSLTLSGEQLERRYWLKINLGGFAGLEFALTRCLEPFHVFSGVVFMIAKWNLLILASPFGGAPLCRDASGSVKTNETQF